MHVKKKLLESGMENRWAPNWKWSFSRLNIVILLINLYAEYILWNAGLNEAQAGIKIAGRNIRNRYAGDSNFMADSEQELMIL